MVEPQAMSLRTENSWVGMPRSRATSLEREQEFSGEEGMKITYVSGLR